MIRIGYVLVVIIALSIFTMISCSGSSNSDSDGTGTLSFYLMDKTTDELAAVYITIDSVQVHVTTSDADEDTGESETATASVKTESEDKEQKAAADDSEDDSGNWEVIANPEKTYNLLELVNGNMEELGLSDLEAGHYTQIRLNLGEDPDTDPNMNNEAHPFANYIITKADMASHELKVPSGYQSGIKLVHGFEIEEGKTVELLIDFDAAKSVVQAGNSGKYLLKPTMKIIALSTSGTVLGRVAETGSSSQYIENVMVSAQTYDDAASTILGQVTVVGSTITDTSGQYKLLLDPGTYDIVYYKSGYTLACHQITLESGDALIQDVSLEEESDSPGTFSGLVTIESGSDDDSVTLSIRQTVICQNTSETVSVEVMSLQIANGGSFSVNLAPGTYDLVVSGEELITQTYQDISIIADITTTQDILFE